MAKNFFLQELPSEKEYEKNISGIIYKITNSKSSDGIYINYIGQPITQTLSDSNKALVISDSIPSSFVNNIFILLILLLQGLLRPLSFL